MARTAILESRIMELIWDVGSDGMTPEQVRSALEPDHPVAYTTAMTVLVRLWKKGRLERTKEGRAYRYRPTETREAHEARRMNEILHSFDDHSVLLSRFVDGLSANERRVLKRMIDDE